MDGANETLVRMVFPKVDVRYGVRGVCLTLHGREARECLHCEADSLDEAWACAVKWSHFRLGTGSDALLVTPEVKRVLGAVLSLAREAAQSPENGLGPDAQGTVLREISALQVMLNYTGVRS